MSFILKRLFKPKPLAKVIPIKTPQSQVDPNLSYSNLYAVAQVLPQHQAELNNIAAIILRNKPRYDLVSVATGMPWYLIAAIHSLEASLSFSTYLHNGDPLFNSDGRPVKTVHVPKGIGPFLDWQSAAIDALSPPETGPWTVGKCLEYAERYNGMGYKNHGYVDPYLFSYTNLYVKGKYKTDGKYSPDAVSEEPGVAAIFKTLNIGIT